MSDEMSHSRRLTCSRSTHTAQLAQHTADLLATKSRGIRLNVRPMEHRHGGQRKMTTGRRRRRCCLVGAAIFSAWGQGRSSSSSVSVSAFGFGGGPAQQSVCRSLRWAGAGVSREASTPISGAGRIRSRTPSPPAEAEALSATSRRRSAFVVEGGVGPAAASTTQDWRDFSAEVGDGVPLLCA